MFNTTEKVVGGIVALVLVFGLGIYLGRGQASHPPASTPNSGAVGDLTAELYDPYIQQNGGYFSNLPVSTTGLLQTTGTAQVGTNGTTITQLNFGAGNTASPALVIAYSNTIAASSTVRVDIGSTGQVGGTLTGVTPSSQCDVYATTTVGTWGGMDVISSFASTTAGYCTVNLWNQTGATFTWTATASTSFAYQSFR